MDDYDDVAKIDNANDIIDNNNDNNSDNDNNNKRLHSPIRRRWDPHFHVLASFLSSSSLLSSTSLSLSSSSLGYKEL